MLAIIAHKNKHMTPTATATSPPRPWRHGIPQRIGNALTQVAREIAVWIFMLGGLLSVAKYAAIVLVWGGNTFLRVRANIPV